MMSGDLPPSSREHFLRLLLAQEAIICLPTGVDPVKPTLRTSGWSMIA